MLASKQNNRSATGRFWTWQSRNSPYLFVLPFVLLFLVFLVYPVGRSLILSTYKSAGPREKEFVGLGNYAFLIRDRIFWLAVLNTLSYTVLYLSLYIPASLGLALLLNSPRVRCRNVFRFAFFSTHLVGQVFVAVIFVLLLSPRQGLVDRILGVFIESAREWNWRGDSSLAIPALVLASLWISIGYGMVYFLAALQAVDQELYEAADVDGAGWWSKFWHITVPGIKPVLIFIFLVGTIGSFQLFEIPYVLFDPPYGPRMRTLTIVMYLYQQGFEFGMIGYAAAIGWVLVLIIFLISMAQLKFTGGAKDI